MSCFRVELKKVVDDSYDLQIGKNLIDNIGRASCRERVY